MADNTTLNVGAGGDVIATDDIAGVKHQQVKVEWGVDGTATPVSAANPMPVVQTGTHAVNATLAAETTKVIGTINVAAAQTLATVTTVSTVTNVATIGTSVTPGTAAANLGKAVDSVAGATDTGVAPLYVRDDALTTLTPVDGDYVHGRATSTGAQWVAIASGGIAGIVDDAAFTPATSEVLPIGMQADDTATDSVDEGDIGCPRMSLDRKQYVIAHQETGAIYQAGISKTPVFAAISGSTSGDNTLVAAAGASNKIRVTSLYLVSAGTTTVRFESGASGTALSGVMSLIANTGFVLPHNPNGWFETAANTLLNMELNAAIQVSGGLSYIVVT